jgi:hypothetical protein
MSSVDKFLGETRDKDPIEVLDDMLDSIRSTTPANADEVDTTFEGERKDDDRRGEPRKNIDKYVSRKHEAWSDSGCTIFVMGNEGVDTSFVQHEPARASAATAAAGAQLNDKMYGWYDTTFYDAEGKPSAVVPIKWRLESALGEKKLIPTVKLSTLTPTSSASFRGDGSGEIIVRDEHGLALQTFLSEVKPGSKMSAFQISLRALPADSKIIPDGEYDGFLRGRSSGGDRCNGQDARNDDITIMKTLDDMETLDVCDSVAWFGADAEEFKRNQGTRLRGSLRTWHARLNHAGLATIKHAEKHGTGMTITSKKETPCPSCFDGKGRRVHGVHGPKQGGAPCTRPAQATVIRKPIPGRHDRCRTAWWRVGQCPRRR